MLIEELWWNSEMKRYFPLVVFVVGVVALFLWLSYYGPSEELPGHMEPTGQSEQTFTHTA